MDFNQNIKIEKLMMPWNVECVQATYDENADDRLHGFKVIIVADTINGSDERLTTMITRFPRCILPEVNTHRVFSRNSASSRARSVRTTIGDVMREPYVPLFTENHKGMGGALIENNDDIDRATSFWLAARDSAVESELRMLVGDTMQVKASDWEHVIDEYYEHIYNNDNPGPEYENAPNIHKQNANRLIEPFMWHEALITSAYWNNFYHLRISEFAQPEIHALAVLMKAAQDASEPVNADIHLPFIDMNTVKPLNEMTWDELRGVLMDSASECARISYRDRSKLAKSDNHALAERLLHDGHMSPLEHQAIDSETYERLGDVNDFNVIPADVFHDDGNMHGNLTPGWIQCRHILGN